jgi:hypothetical protein
MKSTLSIGSLILLSLLLINSPVIAQSGSDWQMPRTIDGHPDLQGVWENNTITPVERPDVFGDKSFLTDEDVVFLKNRIAEIEASGGDALFGDGVLQAAFAGEIVSYDPSTGNYDSQWMADRTIHRRTSQIIDPPNGKFPPRTERAIAASSDLAQHRKDHPADSWLDRPLSERCISYGSPTLHSGYNSYWQIVQSKDTVVIVQEMIHDVRIIPLVAKPHADEDIKLWHGDSRGYWDGDILVIETTNYSDRSTEGPDVSRKVNVERLTRTSDGDMQYVITSDDPGTYTAPYTREIILEHSSDEIYEYACHEGNYGMAYILSGHRVEERMAVESGSE